MPSTVDFAECRFCARTVQTNVLRLVFEGIKEILQDCNLIVSPEGIKVVCPEQTNRVLVHMKLNAKNFDEFYCAEDRILVGLHLQQFHNLIKNAHNNDTITLFVLKDVPHKIGIHIDHGDQDHNKMTRINLSLLNIDDNHYEIPAITFSYVIRVSTIELQRTFREMSKYETVTIMAVQKQLIFSASNDASDMERIFTENPNENMTFLTSPAESSTIVQGRFSLKHLYQFTKCSNLKSVVTIYLENDKPIIIMYEAGNLGTLKFMLAAKETDAA